MNIPWAFDSWQSFFAMGKHGLYVWSSYGIFFGLILLLVIVSYLQFRHWKITELKRLSRLKMQQEFHQSHKETLKTQHSSNQDGEQQ